MNKRQTNGLTSALGADRRPTPEVRPCAKLRSFPAAYKRLILAEPDAAIGKV